MLKRTLTAVLVTVLILSISVIPSLAAPYTDIKIGYGTSTIEAINFDTENFNDVNPSEKQWNVRTDMEAVQGPQTEVGASGYLGNIGWISAGEWVQYTVTVEAAGKYNFKAYIASGADPAGTIAVSYDGTAIGQATSANLGGDTPWQAYDWYNVGDVEMAAGTHVIKLDFTDGNLNFAALEVTALFEEPTTVLTEAPTTAADGATAAEGETTAAPDNETETNNNMLLWILIAAGAVIVIVIIAVLVTRKKK